jgi:hypothetical protein
MIYHGTQSERERGTLGVPILLRDGWMDGWMDIRFSTLYQNRILKITRISEIVCYQAGVPHPKTVQKLIKNHQITIKNRRSAPDGEGFGALLDTLYNTPQHPYSHIGRLQTIEAHHQGAPINPDLNLPLIQHTPIRHAAEPGTVDVVGESERGGVVPGRQANVCLFGRAPRPPGVILL